MTLENKNILITGASRGIGKALAKDLALRHNKLCLFSTNELLLKELVEEFSPLNKNIIYKAGDVSNIKDVEEVFEFAKKHFGKIDIAILNAGLGHRLDSKEYDFEGNKKIFDVNFYGVLNFLKYLIPYMKENGTGTIVGISSLADVRGFPFSASYSASKAALSTYLEGIRIELKPINIKVINVRPGFVDTEMIKNNKFKMLFILSKEKASRKIINGIEKEKSVIQFPLFYIILTSITKVLPNFIYNFIMKNSK